MFVSKTKQKQTTQDQTKQKTKARPPALVILLTLILHITPGILNASRLEESFVLYKYVHRNKCALV